MGRIENASMDDQLRRANTLLVGPGMRYTTPQAAVDAAVAGGADSTHPWLIHPAPGVYTITTPIVLAPGIYIVGDGMDVCKIYGVDVATCMIRLASYSGVFGITVENYPSVGTNQAIESLTVNISDVYIQRCRLVSASYCLHVDPGSGKTAQRFNILDNLLESTDPIFITNYIDWDVSHNVMSYSGEPVACLTAIDGMVSGSAVNTCYGLRFTHNSADIVADNSVVPSEGPYAIRLSGNGLTIAHNTVRMRWVSTDANGLPASTSMSNFGIALNDAASYPASFIGDPDILIAHNMLEVTSDADVAVLDALYCCLKIAHTKSKTVNVRVVNNDIRLKHATAETLLRIFGEETAGVAATGTNVTPTNAFTTAAAHNLRHGDPVVFATTNGNITAGTIYYVKWVSATVFQVAATVNGVAIVLAAHANTLDCKCNVKLLNANFYNNVTVTVTDDVSAATSILVS